MKITLQITIYTNRDFTPNETAELAQDIEAETRYALWPEVTDQVNDVTVKAT